MQRDAVNNLDLRIVTQPKSWVTEWKMNAGRSYKENGQTKSPDRAASRQQCVATKIEML